VNENGSASIEDVSTNGTYINGVKIGKNVTLDARDGDVLTMGKPNSNGPPGAQSGCINFRVTFADQAPAVIPMLSPVPLSMPMAPLGRTSTPPKMGNDSMVYRQQIEDLKVLASQADHRSQMSERRTADIQFKLNAAETELKRTKETNVELVVRNESMRSEIEQLRSRLQQAERTAYDSDKRTESLQAKVEYMNRELSEINTLKASLNLKHTTLSEEVERLRRENYDLNNRLSLSGDSKRRLLSNLQSMQQLLGASVTMVQDMGTIPETSPYGGYTTGARGGPTNMRTYPMLVEPGVEAPADNYFIGSIATVTGDQQDAYLTDGLGGSRKPSDQ